jgi:predicted DNA-binding transcriptional regulator AlpA
MPEHNFTLLITGDVEGHFDELYEAGCDDATFGSVDGVQYADFARQAGTLSEAIASAIGDIESVDGLRVVRVEPEDLVTAAEIAKRLGRSRESIRLLATGERGAGFPTPVSHIRSRNRLWRWAEVATWAGKATPEELAAARVIAAANGALELRNAELAADDRAILAGLAG